MPENRNVKHRDTNFELLRIVSMILIVAHHYVVNSGLLSLMEKNPFAENSLFFYISGAWGKIGINCFVMITGYFMCKSQITLRKFLKLIMQIEFYRIIFYFIFLTAGYYNFSPTDFIKRIIPVKSVSNGFVQAFLVFFLFIPFLNVLLKNLSEKMHLRLIILCLFLYTFLSSLTFCSVKMNYVSWFMVIYFISSYVRLHNKAVFNKSGVWAAASAISLLVSALSIIYCMKKGMDNYFYISDSNKILAVVTSFCIFMFFKNFRIKYNKYINIIAGATFGVLLIHANSGTMRQWLWTDTTKNTLFFDTEWCYLHFACSVIGVFTICAIIELLRIYFLEKPFFVFYDKHSQKVYSKLRLAEDKLLKKIHVK